MLSSYYEQRMEERRRNSRLAGKEHDHLMMRREAELAEREQDRTERKERWKLEKLERMTGLVREWIEIAMNVVCFSCAIVLLVLGSQTGHISLLGGSGATGFLWYRWMLHLSSGRRESAARASSSLSSGG